MTRLEFLVKQYVEDEISIEILEERLGSLLESGREDDGNYYDLDSDRRYLASSRKLSGRELRDITRRVREL